MSNRRKEEFIAAVSILLVALLFLSGCAATEDDGRELLFDMPGARVAENDYGGQPAVGEHLTPLPYLAELPRTDESQRHEVRLDVVAQEVEVAPGVRYLAWTFGGTVPGPVLHVREGDVVDFTMANRSDEPVQVSEPSVGAEAALAAAALQRPIAAVAWDAAFHGLPRGHGRGRR